MALHDWITTSYEIASATITTVATLEHENSRTVASVAVVNQIPTNSSSPEAANHPHPVTLKDLMGIHPAIVEGCNLVDILAHAIPDDYEDLANPLILATFARALRDYGDIKMVDVRDD